MLNTLLGKERGLEIRLKWASRISASLVRVITNQPFSYLWVATGRDSDNFFEDFILEMQQFILYFSVKDVIPDVSFFLYLFKRKRKIENKHFTRFCLRWEIHCISHPVKWALVCLLYLYPVALEGQCYNKGPILCSVDRVKNTLFKWASFFFFFRIWSIFIHILVSKTRTENAL